MPSKSTREKPRKPHRDFHLLHQMSAEENRTSPFNFGQVRSDMTIAKRNPSRQLAVVLAICLLPAPSADGGEDWRPLFDGKSLAGWQGVRGPLDNWAVDRGVLISTGKSGSKWIATQESFDDFELEVEFNVSPGGNSGVFLRAPLEGRPAFEGIEIQIADDFSPEYRAKPAIKHTGAVYDIEPPARKAAKPAGQWQTMRIRCVGPQLQVFLNGKQIQDVKLDAYPHKEKTHPALKRNGGRIGLQSHGSRIEFRNIRLRRLSESVQAACWPMPSSCSQNT